MSNNEKNYIIGCPDPYSVAETVAGKNINWTEQNDVFDTMAECYGITKEGYLSADSPLQAPYDSVDEKGNARRLSNKEAEERLNAFLEKYARPEKRKIRNTQTKASPTTVKSTSAKRLVSTKFQDLTQAEKRKRAVNVLLMKDKIETPKAIQRKSNITNAEKNDGPHTPNGMQWRDKGYFFNEIAMWSDVCQNNIGDCYFLAALCSVAYVNPFYIQNKTAMRFLSTGNNTGSKQPDTPWHSIDFYVPGSDAESTASWSDKKKSIQHIVVSEEVLVNSSTGFNYGACGAKEKGIRIKGEHITGTKENWDSCWAAVYEKAYAKFLERTSTDRPNMFSGDEDDDKNGIVSGIIRGGCAENALREILHTESVTKRYLSDLTVNEIWNIALTANKHPTCCTIPSRKEKGKNGIEITMAKAGDSNYYRDTLGLSVGHVYSLLGCMDYDNKRYIVIRNPHGRNLPALKKNPNVYHKDWGYSFINHEDNEFHNDWFSVYRCVSGNDDPQSSGGLFLMEINEFKRVFNSIEYYTGSSFENYL